MRAHNELPIVLIIDPTRKVTNYMESIHGTVTTHAGRSEQ